VPYFVRFFTPNKSSVKIQDLQSSLHEEFPYAKLSLEDGSDEQWNQFLLHDSNGREIAMVERDTDDGELVSAELKEFAIELEEALPARGTQWVQEYLQGVRVIYAFQILDGIYDGDGWDVLHTLRNALWSNLGGIFQADGEGFSNEDGFHVVWQFSDTASGPWFMALRNSDGSWTRFEMELSDKAQRDAFLKGRVPDGASLIEPE
jgi:hypothetical protein